jgi:hypothetical protein
MKAFIDPTITNIAYLQSWTTKKPYSPIYSTYPNSARVCQVEPDDQTFPIAEPFFWTSCPDNCVADQWYYDTADNICKPIVNAPYPGTVGLQEV